MKLSRLVLTLASLLSVTSALAGSLQTSSNVDLLALDGQKVKKDTALVINDDKVHQVVVSVSSLIDSHYYESAPFVLTFNGSTEDISVQAPEFRTTLDVKKFQDNPTFNVVTASGKQLAFKQDNLKGEGFLPNARVEDNLVKYNLSKAVASVPSFATAPLEAKGQIVVQTDNVSQEQLQLLFKKADKETQKRFLEWAKKQ